MVRTAADVKPLSKAEAYAKMRSAREAMAQVVADMGRETEAFKEAVRKPPIHLTVQRQAGGLVYLRWRRSGIRGAMSYLTIEGPEGRAWLNTLEAPVRKLYLRFSKTALYLNYLHSVALNEARRIERYIAQLDALPDA